MAPDGLDQLQAFGEECEVPMNTLANVFDETLDGRAVDFLNVQVNGHELAVLDGLGHWTDRIRLADETKGLVLPYDRRPRVDDPAQALESHSRGGIVASARTRSRPRPA